MENVANYGTILSLLPPLVAVILAFTTKEATFSLMIALFTFCIVAGQNPLMGFCQLAMDALGNADFVYNCSVEFFIGIMIAYFMKCGAMDAVTKFVTKKIKLTNKIAQILAAILGIVIYFSDYFSPLFVGQVARPFCDEAKVSREKLAYFCDSTSAPMCISVPFSGWSVYCGGLIVGFGPFVTSEDGMNALMHAFPYQFYGVLTILMVLLIATGILPDFGPMKKAEERARTTGQLWAEGDSPMIANDLEGIAPPEGKEGNVVIDFLIPALIIIVGSLGSYLILGGVKLPQSFLAAILYQAIVLVVRRWVSLKELMSLAMDGIKTIISAVVILCLAYMINSGSKMIGTAAFVIKTTESFMTPVTLLTATFLIGAFVSFFTGSSWGTFAIMMPIAVPYALQLSGGEANGLVYAAIAAVMGGGTFGDHCSPLSDTSIISSLGAGSDHIAHVKTQIPYALTVCVIASIAYLVVGFTFN